MNMTETFMTIPNGEDIREMFICSIELEIY